MTNSHYKDSHTLHIKNGSKSNTKFSTSKPNFTKNLYNFQKNTFMLTMVDTLRLSA